MSRALDYSVRLIDEMSQPAYAASASMSKIARSVRDTQEKISGLTSKYSVQSDALIKLGSALDAAKGKGAAGAVEAEKLTAAYRKQAEALQATSRTIRNSNERLSDLKKASKKGSGGLMGMALNAAKMLGPLAVAAVSFKALAGAAQTAFEARGHKLAIMGQLQSITGSADKAKEVYDHTQKIADNLNVSQDRVQELSTDLLKARMPSTSLEATITAITALEKGQGPEAAAKLQSIVKGSTFKKSFGITREDALALGTNMQEVYSEIAKSTGQGLGEVRAQMAYGQIGIKTGLDALNAIATRKNRAALDVAKMDPAALFGKFKETLSRLFEDVDLSPISDALKAVTLMFDRTTVTGKSFKTMINGIVSVVGALISYAVPIVGKLVDLFTLLGLRIYVALIPVFGTVRRLLKALHLDGGFFGDMMAAKFTAVAKILERIGQALKVVSAGIDVGSKLLEGKDTSKAGDRLGNEVYKLVNPKEGFFRQGVDIADGLSGGILSKIGLVENTSRKMAQTVPATVAKELEIRSPSRVLKKQGKDTGQGYIDGVEESGAGNALAGIGDSVPDVKAGAVSGANAFGPAAGQPRGSVTFGDFYFQIDGGATGEETARTAYEKFLEMIEPLALQLGGPVGYGV